MPQTVVSEISSGEICVCHGSLADRVSSAVINIFRTVHSKPSVSK